MVRSGMGMGMGMGKGPERSLDQRRACSRIAEAQWCWWMLVNISKKASAYGCRRGTAGVLTVRAARAHAPPLLVGWPAGGWLADGLPAGARSAELARRPARRAAPSS